MRSDRIEQREGTCGQSQERRDSKKSRIRSFLIQTDDPKYRPASAKNVYDLGKKFENGIARIEKGFERMSERFGYGGEMLLQPRRPRKRDADFSTAVPTAHCWVIIEGVDEPLSLAEVLAISRDWESTNERRAALIERKVTKRITIKERVELQRLQKLAWAKRQMIAPLPIKELAEIEASLREKNLWLSD